MLSAYIYTHYLLSGAVNKLHDIEERIRRTEDSSKENKSALGKLRLTIRNWLKYYLLPAQLISHTKNVERAVTMSQQDMVSKKEQQGTKIQELNHKLASVQQVGGVFLTLGVISILIFFVEYGEQVCKSIAFFVSLRLPKPLPLRNIIVN